MPGRDSIAPHSFSLCGVDVAVTNLDRSCDVLLRLITRRKNGAYVCIAPASTIVDSRRGPAYRAVVNGSVMTTPDGMPLVWFARLIGHKDVGRTYGPDLLPAMCRAGLDSKVRHYFYGGTNKVNEKLTASLQQRFPGLEIAGLYAPAVRPVHFREDDGVIEAINAARPDILWVGLGSPKQDHWMAEHRDRLRVPVIVGVGAAFDFLAGVKPQAPRWMQRSGLEWLFRLCCEPRRLWKRYLIGNSLFLYYVLIDHVLKRNTKKGPLSA